MMDILTNPLTLNIVNNVCFNLALVVILYRLVKAPVWVYVLYFVAITVPCVLLYSYCTYFMLPLALCSSVLVYAIERHYSLALTKSAGAVFMLLTATLIASSSIILLFPDFVATPFYNYAMSLCIVVYAAVVSLVLRFRPLKLPTGLGLYLVLLMLFAVLVYYSVLRPGTELRNLHDMAVENLFTVLVWAVQLILLRLLYKTEKEKTTAQLTLASEAQYRENVKRQFDAIIRHTHYCRRIFKSLWPLVAAGDVESIKKYYTTHIAPAYSQTDETETQAQNIQDIGLKSLIQGVAAELDALCPAADIQLSVPLPFAIAQNVAQDVFVIATVLLENAMQSIAEQDRGLLRIRLIVDIEYSAIEIANTCPEGLNIQDVLYHHSEGTGRYSLLDVATKVKLRKEFTHSTFTERGSQGTLLVQRLLILKKN